MMDLAKSNPEMLKAVSAEKNIQDLFSMISKAVSAVDQGEDGESYLVTLVKNNPEIAKMLVAPTLNAIIK
jgi:hypothetical protein